MGWLQLLVNGKCPVHDVAMEPTGEWVSVLVPDTGWIGRPVLRCKACTAWAHGLAYVPCDVRHLAETPWAMGSFCVCCGHPLSGAPCPHCGPGMVGAMPCHAKQVEERQRSRADAVIP